MAGVGVQRGPEVGPAETAGKPKWEGGKGSWSSKASRGISQFSNCTGGWLLTQVTGLEFMINYR